MAKEFVVTFGGWYQRTTLHLTEIYDFFAHGISRLELSKDKLKNFREELEVEKVIREVGYLEYVKVLTKNDIEIRYYEDGLYVLGLVTDNIDKASSKLTKYFEGKFEPAIGYIFSLGAPTTVRRTPPAPHPTPRAQKTPVGKPLSLGFRFTYWWTTPSPRTLGCLRGGRQRNWLRFSKA